MTRRKMSRVVSGCDLDKCYIQKPNGAIDDLGKDLINIDIKFSATNGLIVVLRFLQFDKKKDETFYIDRLKDSLLVLDSFRLSPGSSSPFILRLISRLIPTGEISRTYNRLTEMYEIEVQCLAACG